MDIDKLNKSKLLVDKTTYFERIFDFGQESKAEFLNVIQYSTTSIIPIILLNMLLSRFTPNPDNDKGTLEIFIEILIQIIIMVILLFFVNRIVVNIPSYSGYEFTPFSLSSFLVLLFVMISFQTKLSEKIQILLERVEHLWNGSGNEGSNKKPKKTQPISQQQMISNNANISGGVTSISSLPINPVLEQQQQPVQSPNFNNFYSNQETPLIGANTPNGDPYGSNNIMAANEMLGSSFGASF